MAHQSRISDGRRPSKRARISRDAASRAVDSNGDVGGQPVDPPHGPPGSASEDASSSANASVGNHDLRLQAAEVARIFMNLSASGRVLSRSDLQELVRPIAGRSLLKDLPALIAQANELLAPQGFKITQMPQPMSMTGAKPNRPPEYTLISDAPKDVKKVLSFLAADTPHALKFVERIGLLDTVLKFLFLASAHKATEDQLANLMTRSGLVDDNNLAEFKRELASLARQRYLEAHKLQNSANETVLEYCIGPRSVASITERGLIKRTAKQTLSVEARADSENDHALEKEAIKRLQMSSPWNIATAAVEQ